MHWGGIRHRVFGTKNGLTKAALIRADRGMELFVYWHHVRGGAVADFTAVLLHYPFVATFAAKVADAVATGRYGANTSREYRAGARSPAGMGSSFVGQMRRSSETCAICSRSVF
jgi:hypothetical protein